MAAICILIVIVDLIALLYVIYKALWYRNKVNKAVSKMNTPLGKKILAWALEEQMDCVEEKVEISSLYFEVDMSNKDQHLAYLCGRMQVLEELLTYLTKC